MINIIEKNRIIKNKVEKGFSQESVIYDNNFQPIPGTSRILKMTNSGWNEKNPKFIELWTKIRNAQGKARSLYEKEGSVVLSNSGFTTPNDLYTFIDLMRLDITARIMYEPDYTELLATTYTDSNFDETMKLDQFRPYAAMFKKISGHGDSVPLIEPKTGGSTTVDFEIFGVGYVRTLHSLLYDKLFTMQKVNEAIARAWAFRRNERTLQDIIGQTYSGAYQTPASTTPNASPDLLAFQTMKNAIQNMAGLPHPQSDSTKRFLSIDGGVYLVIHPSNIPKYEPILRGVIDATTSPENLQRLDGWIRGIIPFAGDEIFMGEETFTLAGCPTNKAYLVAPGWALLLIKNGLSVQTGQGSALNLSQSETAWWHSETVYNDDAYRATMEILLP